MGIVQKHVDVEITPYNEKHYKALGYKTELRHTINVDVNDLSHGSGILVDVICDYCGSVFQKQYRRYVETKDDVCCKNCRKHKFAKTNMQKYGVACTLREKSINKKMLDNNMKKYGAKYPMQVPEFAARNRESFKRNHNGKVTTGQQVSKQEIYITNLYGAKRDVLFSAYTLDGYFEKEKIYIEYDGTGHDLCVKFGKVTREEFNKREEKREKYLLSLGLRGFRIKSSTDKLPDDKKLLEIKEIAFNKLCNEDYYLCVYDIDKDCWNFSKE